MAYQERLALVDMVKQVNASKEPSIIVTIPYPQPMLFALDPLVLRYCALIVIPEAGLH